MKYFFFTLSLALTIISCNPPEEQVENYSYQITLTKADPVTNNAFIALQKNRLALVGIPENDIEIKTHNGEIQFLLKNISIKKNTIQKLFLRSGNLEIWNTFENVDVYPTLEEINKKLFIIQSQKQAADSISKVPNVIDTVEKSLFDYKEENTHLDSSRKENPFFAVLMPALVQIENGQYIFSPGPVIGYADSKDTSLVNYYLQLEEIQKIIPRNLKFFWSYKTLDTTMTAIELIAIKDNGIRNFIAPENIVQEIKKVRDDSHYAILLTMTKEAAEMWEIFTAANIEQSIALVQNSKVLSYPTVKAKIANGCSSITGNYTSKEIDEIVCLLKAGALPYNTTIVSEKVVE